MNIKDTIVGWLGTLKGKANSSGSVKKWILYAIIAIVAFFVVAYLSNRAFRKWKELAELKHKMDVLKEEKHQAEVAKKVEQIQEKIEKHDETIKQKQTEIDVVDSKIVELNEKWELEREKIKAIQNWDELDKYARTAGAK